MAFEKRPGDLAVFRNTRKQEGDNKPDYEITGLTLDGRPMKGALWLKKDRNGKTFMAGNIAVDEYAESKSGGGGGSDSGSGRQDRVSGRDRERQEYDLNDDIPFLRW